MALVHVKTEMPSGGGEPRAKRRRRAPSTFQEEYEMDAEQRALLHQAIQNSRKENISVDTPVEEAPVFYPTEEEFADPIRYIARCAQVPVPPRGPGGGTQRAQQNRRPPKGRNHAAPPQESQRHHMILLLVDKRARARRRRHHRAAFGCSGACIGPFLPPSLRRPPSACGPSPWRSELFIARPVAPLFSRFLPAAAARCALQCIACPYPSCNISPKLAFWHAVPKSLQFPPSVAAPHTFTFPARHAPRPTPNPAPTRRAPSAA